MRKRDRATEPGSRLVDCFYCSTDAPKVAFNTLDRHTERHHGPPKLFPARTRDAVPIGDFFRKKRQKVQARQPSQPPGPAA